MSRSHTDGQDILIYRMLLNISVCPKKQLQALLTVGVHCIAEDDGESFSFDS